MFLLFLKLLNISQQFGGSFEEIEEEININNLEVAHDTKQCYKIMNTEKKKYYSILYFLFKNTRGKQRKDWKIDKVYNPSTKRWIETFYFAKISKYCVKETQLVTDLVPHAHGTLLYGASPTVVDSKTTQKWFKNPFDAIYYFATLVNRVDEIKEEYFNYKNHPEHKEKVSGFEKYFN